MVAAGRRASQRVHSPVTLNALQVLARSAGVAGRTLEEVGLLLKRGLMSSAIRLVKVAQIMSSITVGGGGAASIPHELLPLPVVPAGPEETRLVQALQGGMQPDDLDNYDQGRVVLASSPVSEEGAPTAMQQALRDVYVEWGVARSEKKAGVEVVKGLILGAEVLGKEGRSKPTSLKACKFLFLLWHGMSLDTWRPLHLSHMGGAQCFFKQFRRASFIVFCCLWDAIPENAPVATWGEVADELLAAACLMPLDFIDFRTWTSSIVSCSDASEEGAGVCVARALSDDGVEQLVRKLAPMPGLMDGLVVLHESFCGLASTRVYPRSSISSK